MCPSFNPHDITKEFEEQMARFTGASYGVAVESCTAAIFLCCICMGIDNYGEIEIPKHTYPSVPAMIIHAGGKVRFVDDDWQTDGYYELGHTGIIDSAKRISQSMYQKSTLTCLSFHGKKVLPIGRGGMILTDNKEAVKWFKLARFDGRHEVPLEFDIPEILGYNMYLTPEQALRGLELMLYLKGENVSKPDIYPDLSKLEIYK